MSKYNPNEGESYVWGVDPAIVEAAMQRGRLERSKAFHGFWRALAAYATGRGHDDASSVATDSRAAKVAAC